VKLQSQNSAGTCFIIFVGTFDRGDVVNEVFEVVALRDDAIVVPVFVFDLRLDLVRLTDRANNSRLAVFTNDSLLAAIGQNSTETLAVQNSGVSLAGFEVALVPANDPLVVFNFKAAVLNARVAADDLVLQRQLEIADITAAPDDERVAFGRLFGRCLTGDRSVANAPESGLPSQFSSDFPSNNDFHPSSAVAIEQVITGNTMAAVVSHNKANRQERNMQFSSELVEGVYFGMIDR
jgi:hypothetical protein